MGSKCCFCGKPATRLCDAPIGRAHYLGHPPRHLMFKAILLCKNDKTKIKAYQCELCGHFDVDDLSENTFCHCGFWPGRGDPDGRREAFTPVKHKIIGAHL